MRQRKLTMYVASRYDKAWKCVNSAEKRILLSPSRWPLIHWSFKSHFSSKALITKISNYVHVWEYGFLIVNMSFIDTNQGELSALLNTAGLLSRRKMSEPKFLFFVRPPSAKRARKNFLLRHSLSDVMGKVIPFASIRRWKSPSRVVGRIF